MGLEHVDARPPIFGLEHSGSPAVSAPGRQSASQPPSSSITRTVKPPSAWRRRGSSVGGCWGARLPGGKATVIVVPRPSMLSIASVLLCVRIIPPTAARPRPRPVNLVVKNGSKMRARVAASMPLPVSETLKTTAVGGCSRPSTIYARSSSDQLPVACVNRHPAQAVW